MAVTETWGRLLWSLQNSGKGPAIAASGNSGPWALPVPPADFAASPVQLGKVSDVLLTVTCTGATGTSPSLTASLYGFDDQGNLIGPFITTTALTGAGGQFASGGLHAATAAAYAVLPIWGQVAWTVTGTTPSFAGTEICLYGR